MRLKTITCHDVYNFGASLQAYALQSYLRSLGHDVEIIDYKPDYLSGHFKFSAVSNPIFDKPLIKQLYLLAKLPERLIALPRKRVFDKFTRKYLRLTRRYNSYEALKSAPPEADCYIAGSDQIWNTLFRNGRDAAFYLDFGKPDVRRISYAASFATADVVPEYRRFVSDELKKFDAISIREKVSLPLLASLGRTDGVAVCDPVFLLSQKEWIKLINNTTRQAAGKYILVYLTDKSRQIEAIAKEIAKETEWKIYTVGASRMHGADKNFVNAGPLDFVRLIKDAQFVISNSFHATAFSLIMGVKFCVVNRSEGINERMRSILEDYGLSDRLVSEYKNDLLNDIDYTSVNHTMTGIINQSKSWLKAQLNCKK